MSITLGNNVALVLSAFQNNLKKAHTGLKTIHVDDLSYEGILTALRGKDKLFNDSNRDTVVFAYTRRPLKPAQEMRRASKSKGVYYPEAGTPQDLSAIRADIDIDFMFLTNRTPKIDEFEISYWCEKGISSVKYFDVNLSSVDLGVFKYHCKWLELDNKEFTMQDKSYKSISGTCQVTGDFFILEGDLGGRIESIIFKLYEENLAEDYTVLLDEETIP